MQNYDHIKIESKWQKKWDKSKLYEATEKEGAKKFYGLIEFPYPSGDGLHVGHVRSNTAMDIICRKRRREGYNVLYPIGWDAFGLPTENYAIKTGKQPESVTKTNTDNFRRQLKQLGFSFDWSREINTTDPKYYKWTQWIFLQLYKNGLAYKKKMAINWCPKDLIGLANEEVIDGCCERCGTKVEKRDKEQWMLAITKYADRLDKDLDTVDYLERVKIQQRNWIGKSEGAKISFDIVNGDKTVSNSSSKKTIQVFTTRPDTLFGVTYVVLAPEHGLVQEILNDSGFNITNKPAILEYIQKSKSKNDIDRTDDTKEKTGVEIKGVYAINPANQEKIAVWVADYVLADYGTGAVMAVPAHDERDWDFAKKYGLGVRQVIEPVFVQNVEPGKYKEDLPIQDREAIIAIVKHSSENKFLALKWKEVAWGTFITGGVENGQTPEEACLAEIREETGYVNAEFVSNLGVIHSLFYHVPKKVNRFAHAHALLFKLKDETLVEVKNEEKKIHDILWLSIDELKKFLTPDSHLHLLEKLISDNKSYVGNGLLVNSGKFDRADSIKIKKDITSFVGGEWVTTFKLRDWVFSRQRYWGEPIPVIHCEKCGIVTVPEKDLPVKLPKVKNYQPTQTGESPLASIDKWVNTKCPKCKGKAKRETDTMPQWAGSSWYYLRYTDPLNKKVFADKNKLKYWTPVDWYNGGMEHTTLHLLYSRFWHKFLFDLGLVPTSEPYTKRTSHGLILGPGGEKMSKSRGNVVNPDSVVSTVGADTLRIYEMFMGPFDQPIAWDTNNIAGSRRFIEKVWRLKNKVAKNSDVGISASINNILNRTIKKVSEDIESMSFNTAISTMMITVNEMEKSESLTRDQFEVVIKLLAPFAPHVTEELWSDMGNKESIHISSWPVYDQKLDIDSEKNIVVQINGKMKANFKVSPSISNEELEKIARALPEIEKFIQSKKILKTIVVPGRLINFVIN